MRILWLTTRASFDGPGRVLAAILRHWPAGDDLALCALETIAPAFRAQMPARVTLVELRTHGRRDASAFHRFSRVCRNLRPDLVHTQLSRADWVGRPVARWHGLPVVSTIQNEHSRMYDAEFPAPLAWLGTTLDHLTARWVDRFIAVSTGVKADLERAGLDAGRIDVIRNAVDLGRSSAMAPRDAVRAAWPWTGDAFVVGCVAALKTQKNLPVLIDAAALARLECPSLRVVHLGHGPLAADTRRRVTAAGLDDVFRLMGQVEEPMRMLAGMDAFALPSLWEGLPIALLEAMAGGLPCIASRVPGIDEAIEDGVGGVLVPPNDAPALARAIVALARDPDRRRTLGEAARERVRRHFDVTSLAMAYREVAAEVVAAHGSGRVEIPSFAKGGRE